MVIVEAYNTLSVVDVSELSGARFNKFIEAKEVVEKWIQHYNENHPHQTLGYLTPEEYYAKRLPQNLPEGAPSWMRGFWGRNNQDGR